MLSKTESNDLHNFLGRELQGKLNEYLLLILLTKNYDAAMRSHSEKPERFKTRKTPLITEGLTTRIIAEELSMPQSTAATAVARLVKRKLVTHSKGMPVKTQKTGRTRGNEILRHHRLLEVLLANSLGMSYDDAHNEALKLMLIASCELIQEIDKQFNSPKTCPCGFDIPDSPLCNV